MSGLKKALTGLIVLLVIAGAACVGVELWLRMTLPDKVASELQSVWLTPEEPRVEFSDRFLLPAILQRRLSGVKVSAKDVTLATEKDRLKLDELQVQIPVVEVRGANWDQYYAGSLSASGRLSDRQVSKITGFPVTLAPDKMQVTYKLELFGKKLDVKISVTPTANYQTQSIELTQPEVGVLGVKLPVTVSKEIVAQVAKPIKVPLPKGFTMVDVAAGNGYLQVDLDGREIMLNELLSQPGR